jgi:methionyl-tRNA formyltransferase
MRLAFMGTPEFAARSLAAVLDAGHNVVRVYTQPSRPAGRGQRPQPSAVAMMAAARGLSLAMPPSLKDRTVQAEFAALRLDVAVVVAYGLLLPQPVLDAPRLGCVNVHASLLPRWRGAAPIQRAILAGDKETGITIMRMDAGLDTGPVLLSERVPIGVEDTAERLHDTLAAKGAALLVKALEGLAAGTLAAKPQPAEGATHARKLGREEGKLDWRETAEALARRVRAFTPWPGAYVEHAGERIKILKAEAAPGAGAPGTVLDNALTVACGTGALRLLVVQRAGKDPVEAPAFLNGYALPRGTVLGA